jgi:hypothetical protein
MMGDEPHWVTMARGFLLAVLAFLALMGLYVVGVIGIVIVENWGDTGPYVIGAMALIIVIYVIGHVDRKYDILSRMENKIGP